MKAVAGMGVDTTPWTTPRRKRGGPVEANLSPDDPIALRAEALCLYWAKLAEADEGVRGFRKNVLGGAVVSESEAHDFIHSPGTTRLHKLAAELCRRYPWEPQDAVWFVLTGEVPWVPPLTARIKGPSLPNNHGTITITAMHWVPNATVGTFYAELRARYVDSGPTPSLRQLAVFRFVTEQSSGITERLVYGLNTPPWRSLQSQWNEEYPQGHDWHYSDHRNLRRDFKEAFEALIGYW